MSIIDDGVYMITKPNGLAASITIALGAPADPNSRVLLLPRTPGQESKWTVTNVSDGNVTIQNVATRSYLGFQGKHVVNHFCTQTLYPVEWRIQPSAESGKFHVVVPGGLVGGSELAFDISPLKIFPPVMALAEVRLQDVEQAWGFASEAG